MKSCVCVYFYTRLSSRRAILCCKNFVTTFLFTFFTSLSLYKYKEIQQTFPIELSMCFFCFSYPNFSKPTKQKRTRAHLAPPTFPQIDVLNPAYLVGCDSIRLLLASKQTRGLTSFLFISFWVCCCCCCCGSCPH